VVCLALVLVGIRYSQITLGAGLVAHAWATRRVAWLQGTGAWMRRGSLGLDVWPLVVGTKGTHDHIDGSHHHFAHPMRTWMTSDSGCSTACGIKKREPSRDTARKFRSPNVVAGRRAGNSGDGVPAWNSLPRAPREPTRCSFDPGIHRGRRFLFHPCATPDNSRGWSPVSVIPVPGTPAGRCLRRCRFLRVHCPPLRPCTQSSARLAKAGM
jgi:hypothetical protein